MKHLPIACALLTFSFLPSSSFGHGGRFHGEFPLSKPEPSASSAGSGVCSMPGPHTPRRTPGGCYSPSGVVPVPGPLPDASPIDRTLWQYWWDVNRDQFASQPRASIVQRESILHQRVVPAILATLDSSHEENLVAACLIALAKIGEDPRGLDHSTYRRIALFVGSPKQTIAESATLALGILGDARAMETLIQQLDNSERNSSVRTRAFSAYALGLLGNRIVLPEHRQRIADALWRATNIPLQETRDVRSAAFLAMGLVPLESNPLDLWKDYVPSSVPRSLEEQVCWLLHAFTSEMPPMLPYLAISHAPRSIAELMKTADGAQLKEHVVAAVAPYVTKRGILGERERRQSAALLFGMIGDCDEDPADVRIRECLTQATGNADFQVKVFSLIALGQVGTRSGSGFGAMEGRRTLRAFLGQHLERGKTQMKPWAALSVGVMERALLKQSGERDSEFLVPLLNAPAGHPRDNGLPTTCKIACAIAYDEIPAEPIQGLAMDQATLAEVLDALVDQENGLHSPTTLVIALGVLGDKDSTSWQTKYSLNLNYRACTDTLADSLGNGLLNLY